MRTANIKQNRDGHKFIIQESETKSKVVNLATKKTRRENLPNASYQPSPKSFVSVSHNTDMRPTKHQEYPPVHQHDRKERNDTCMLVIPHQESPRLRTDQPSGESAQLTTNEIQQSGYEQPKTCHFAPLFFKKLRPISSFWTRQLR